MLDRWRTSHAHHVIGPVAAHGSRVHGRLRAGRGDVRVGDGGPQLVRGAPSCSAGSPSRSGHRQSLGLLYGGVITELELEQLYVPRASAMNTVLPAGPREGRLTVWQAQCSLPCNVPSSGRGRTQE